MGGWTGIPNLRPRGRQLPWTAWRAPAASAPAAHWMTAPTTCMTPSTGWRVEKQLHGGTPGRIETFGFLGLTNLVTSETQTPTSGSATTKTCAYDAWGRRTTMTSKVGTGTTSWYAYARTCTVPCRPCSTSPSPATTNPSASYGYIAYGAADDETTVGDDDPSDPTGPGEINNNNPLNAYRYTGKRLDTGAGDGLDMGTRRHGPDLGRFRSPTCSTAPSPTSSCRLTRSPPTATAWPAATRCPLSSGMATWSRPTRKGAPRRPCSVRPRLWRYSV